MHILQENDGACVSGAVISWPTEESKEVWGYVTVRNDAHMFWWLYYATSPYKNFSELPLVMWLQVKVVLLPDLRLRPGSPTYHLAHLYRLTAQQWRTDVVQQQGRGLLDPASSEGFSILLKQIKAVLLPRKPNKRVRGSGLLLESFCTKPKPDMGRNPYWMFLKSRLTVCWYKVFLEGSKVKLSYPDQSFIFLPSQSFPWPEFCAPRKIDILKELSLLYQCWVLDPLLLPKVYLHFNLELWW